MHQFYSSKIDSVEKLQIDGPTLIFGIKNFENLKRKSLE
jgi:hypothetical protein